MKCPNCGKEMSKRIFEININKIISNCAIIDIQIENICSTCPCSQFITINKAIEI